MEPSPFEITSTIIFALAILHTFLTPSIFRFSQKLAQKKEQEQEQGHPWKLYHFSSEMFYLLSEVEVVFGIWLIPLIFFFTLMIGWDQTVEYLNTRNFTHALYITVIVVMIGSRPIITFAEKILEYVARLGNDSPGSWWWSIITLGPFLGALLKEPGAMVLSAILLSKKFYPYQISRPFQYATLGLLFANISVGGMLTTFSSRSLFIVAHRWDWDWTYMLTHFGWKVIVGTLLCNALYYFIFRKEFQKHFPKKLAPLEKEEQERPTPFWITLIHLIFITLVIINGENAPIFIGVFILFLGFWSATSFYQTVLHLKSGIMIGFFFAALLVHGELQGWWIIPWMERLGYLGATLTSFTLSALIDNAIVSYMTLDIPYFDDLKHYLVVAGAMSAGGLTIMANAPNVVGHAILRYFFTGRSISFFYLFLGALPPSLIYLSLFWFFK